MDTLDLARLQFAGTTSVHWLFVALTLGLVPLVAVMHTRAVLSGDPVHGRMTRFWGRLYVVNYALGIVTGLVMEFQFGLSWSGLGKFAGNVFGGPLALETLVAFFAESTFLGMWIFGWGRLRPAVHATLIWLVALTAYASAFWILVANGFMQHPVGYEVRDGVAHLTDFTAMLTNPSALLALGHVAAGSLLLGGVFVAGVSGWHWARGTGERDFFRRSLRLGVLVATLASFATFLLGIRQYPVIERTQPAKFEALSGRAIDPALPSWINAAQYVMVYIGALLMLVAMLAALVVFRRNLVRFKAVAVVFAPVYAVALGQTVGSLLYGEPGPNAVPLYVGCLAATAALLVFGERVARRRALAWVLVAMIPLPFVASVTGWLVRETGRQPWIVYGELKVADALSPVSHGTVVASFTVFMTVFVALAVTDWVVIARLAARGPEQERGNDGSGDGVAEPAGVLAGGLSGPGRF